MLVYAFNSSGFLTYEQTKESLEDFLPEVQRINKEATFDSNKIVLIGDGNRPERCSRTIAVEAIQEGFWTESIDDA